MMWLLYFFIIFIFLFILVYIVIIVITFLAIIFIVLFAATLQAITAPLGTSSAELLIAASTLFGITNDVCPIAPVAAISNTSATNVVPSVRVSCSQVELAVLTIRLLAIGAGKSFGSLFIALSAWYSIERVRPKNGASVRALA
jgi:hypothetical protein